MGKWNVPLFIILVGSHWQLISHKNLLIQSFRFLFFVVFWTTSKSACPKSSQIDAFHFTKWMFSGSNNRSCPQNRMRKVFQGFPTPASSLTSLICCLLWVFFQVDFCLSDLRRQSDETLPSERQSLSLGHVPILHYNHPLSPMQRSCRSSLPVKAHYTVTWSEVVTSGKNLILCEFFKA